MPLIIYITDGLKQIDVIIYIAITGLSAASIGLCVICRNRVYSFKTKRKLSPIPSVNFQSSGELNVQRDDSLYEIIDEHKMLDIAY